MNFYDCTRCGNKGVKFSKDRYGNYILKCKYCERKKTIGEDEWQGLEKELEIFDCEQIKNR